jgi:hypothetical protein
MKTENKATYRFFKRELEELLAQGFSTEQALIILKRIHRAIDKWKGYHYAHVCYSAGQSLEYLIQQVQDENREQELKENILENAITYGFIPEDEQSRAGLSQMGASL